METEEERNKRLAQEAADRILAKNGKTREDVEREEQKEAESAIQKVPQNAHSNIKHVIAVMSGKGGVGKSFVTASLATALNKKGYKVGILDADITGPSIPKMFGVHGQIFSTEEGGIPKESKNGIKIMSINLLLDDETQPVIWRGPVIAQAVEQFWTDMMWGDIDYMLVDMPPGTGDVPLTVFQSLPIDGTVIVTSPQELVSMIVKKAYNMTTMMDIPVIGLVENYSYIVCPNCGEEIKVFGESGIDETAAELNVPVLAKIPINPMVAKASDDGDIESLDTTVFEDAVLKIVKG
jgi:Mrp family chromosome partitioning ATPase